MIGTGFATSAAQKRALVSALWFHIPSMAISDMSNSLQIVLVIV